MHRTLCGVAIAATALLAACDRGITMPPVESVKTTRAEVLTQTTPDYPRAEWCGRIGGTASLMVTVQADGKPGAIAVAQSAGSAALDEAAKTAVAAWTFKPATRDGVAAAEQIKVPVTFNAPTQAPAECGPLPSQSAAG